MEEKYMLISMDDEKSKKLAEAIASKTCKKIVNLLAEASEKELSESDIAKKLGLPVNTIEYNLKKLVEARLVEKSKSFFWSTRGKKIPMYKLSKKFIIISPKSTSTTTASKILKNIIPVALISAAGALLIKAYYSAKEPIIYGAREATEQVTIVAGEPAKAGVEEGAKAAADITPNAIPYLVSGFQNYWLFFLVGALIALLIFLVLNWRNLK